MKEKTRKLDDSTVYVIPSAGSRPIKMIIEGEVISQPYNKDFISQFISGLIDMETLFQLIEDNLTEEIYTGTAKMLLSKSKKSNNLPDCRVRMDGDENG